MSEAQPWVAGRPRRPRGYRLGPESPPPPRTAAGAEQAPLPPDEVASDPKV